MEKLSYEEANKRLNKIIELMESGNVTMSEAEKLIDEGQTLIKDCYASLDSAKGKLTELKETIDKLEEV